MALWGQSLHVCCWAFSYTSDLQFLLPAALLEFQIQHGKRPNSLPNPLWEFSQLYFLLRESHVFIQQILVYSTSICACYGPGTRYMMNKADMVLTTLAWSLMDSCRASATHNLKVTFLEAQSFRAETTGSSLIPPSNSPQQSQFIVKFYLLCPWNVPHTQVLLSSLSPSWLS